MRFMACSIWWLFHQIADDGSWVWRCEDEQAEHDEAVGRAKETA